MCVGGGGLRGREKRESVCKLCLLVRITHKRNCEMLVTAGVLFMLNMTITHDKVLVFVSQFSELTQYDHIWGHSELFHLDCVSCNYSDMDGCPSVALHMNITHEEIFVHFYIRFLIWSNMANFLRFSELCPLVLSADVTQTCMDGFHSFCTYEHQVLVRINQVFALTQHGRLTGF